jgi:DNA recombination protein RmuC
MAALIILSLFAVGALLAFMGSTLALGRASAAKAGAEARASRVPELEAALAAALTGQTALKERVRELETSLTEQRKGWEEKVQTLTAAREQLTTQFRALAADALKANTSSFLELANQNFQKFGETAKGDLQQRQTAFEELVKPVRETLLKLEEKVQQSDKEREGSHQALIAQMKSLGEGQELVRTEAGKLVQALRAPNVRGRWGEIELRRIVEHAGLTKEVSFVEQESHGDGERVGRPDLIVKLPGRRSIIVDAKVPLEAFLRSMDAQDEESRARDLKEHAAALAQKIDDVARKDYASLVEGAVDLVVLFLPAEGFVRAAFEADRDLMERAMQKGVVIATPMTLIALLKAVAYGWRQEALAKNAEQVSELGAQLFERLITLGDHFSKVGRGLEHATKAYNEAVGSLEGRVFTTARKLKELKATRGTKELDELKPVELCARVLTREELAPAPRVSLTPVRLAPSGEGLKGGRSS